MTTEFTATNPSKKTEPITLASLMGPANPKLVKATETFDRSASGLVTEQEIRTRASTRNSILLNSILVSQDLIRRRQEAEANGDKTFLTDFIRMHGTRPEDENPIIVGLEESLRDSTPPPVEDYDVAKLADEQNDSAGARAYRNNFVPRSTRFDGSAESAIHIILGKEGLFSNHVADNGGATMMGIASRSWPRDFNNIMEISRTQGNNAARAYAIDFYERNFWNPVDRMVEAKFGNLPEATKDALKFAAFDAAVNGGHGLANRLLNRSGGDVETFMNARMAHLQSLDDWSHFGRGWTNRVNSIAGQALAFEARGPQLALT
jgi:hypothetical protein